jgi:hypothetical protein
MRRIVPPIVIVLCLVLIRSTASSGAEPPPAKLDGKRPVTVLIFQLRIPKTQNFSPDTRIEFVTQDGADASDLGDLKSKKEGDALIFQHDWLIFESLHPRRAILVGPPPKTGEKLITTQVFRLPVPAVPVASDWSKWQKPDCVEQGPASWNFIYNQKPLNRTTKLPPGAFELRYKLEKQVL